MPKLLVLIGLCACLSACKETPLPRSAATSDAATSSLKTSRHSDLDQISRRFPCLPEESQSPLNRNTLRSQKSDEGYSVSEDL